MKIALVTTQSLSGSTIIGRVLPLTEELSKTHEVHVLVHGSSNTSSKTYRLHSAGLDPFRRSPSGKQRQRGFALGLTMLTNAITATMKLAFLKPDVIIIVKSLPENVLAAWLASFIAYPKKIILDVDDFELTANVTTSWAQRAAIHWAERAGAKLAHHIVAATPFLSDHFEQLTRSKKPITMIPTGLRQDYGWQAGSTTYSLQPTHYNLVYAGSISLSSGHRIDLLPDILAGVRREHLEIKLHMYGDGDDMEKLEKMFAEKGLENAVAWHGRFTVEELPWQISASAILLDPVDGSITNRAKSSFRVALATALGLPVVTSDIGIRPYLFPDALHERLFAKPGDASDYANKIINFIKQPLTPAERASLRTHAAQFTWLQLTQKYEKIIAV